MNHSGKIDLSIVTLLLVMCIVSLLSISTAYQLGLSNENYTTKQIVFYIVSFAVLFSMAYVDPDFLKRISIYIYIGCLLLLLGILLLPENISPTINGAKGWFRYGGVSLQPAELSKVGFILALSSIAKKHSLYEPSLRNDLQQLLKMLGLFIPIAMMLISYPDLGNLLTHAFILFCIMLVSTIRPRTLVYLLSLPTAFFVAAFLLYRYATEFFFESVLGLLSDYQAKRFYGWLQPNEYTEAGHQLIQSITSIGAGQLSGYQNITHVPYAYSDMIFSIIGSQYGFIGATLVILMFFLLIYRITVISLNYHDHFGKYVGAGVSGLITYHVFQNIGMSIGLLPITGIGLPFISYGGSALVTVMVAIGFMLSLYRHTKTYMFE
ncbi:FtsW/RodA/SpoVE family cell cycle protein [Lentibacillus saliphilus]|uniref:FtsW/RodA/SpoVE family cell cycle protein n=1 Tax=Lentibacillus saliphilus TaxID=2737028 RepID=UPI001C30A0CC|nr:FtsW/RodA/SpoVE family cell cycle protein [Lentibacillus saliphilus]